MDEDAELSALAYQLELEQQQQEELNNGIERQKTTTYREAT